MSDIPDLKPCPFCGSTNVDHNLDRNDGYYGVECEDCYAQGSTSTWEKTAVKYWNTRSELK